MCGGTTSLECDEEKWTFVRTFFLYSLPICCSVASGYCFFAGFSAITEDGNIVHAVYYYIGVLFFLVLYYVIRRILTELE